MGMQFDITEDELQVFMAEADEQLQTLDTGLVQLERSGESPDLLQAIFRAAHTLKGSAGMIGHRRMAEVTHAMETALDGLRKHTLAVSTPLVDACLEALDTLRLLLAEVSDGEQQPVDIEPIIRRLTELSQPAKPPVGLSEIAPRVGQVVEDPGRAGANLPHTQAARPAKKPAKTGGGKTKNGRRANGRRPAASARAAATSGKRAKPRPAAARQKAGGRSAKPSPAGPLPGVPICADIAEDSFASAARALQAVLALQSLGEVHDLQPPQSAIEMATPVRQLTARLVTTRSAEEIGQALAGIPDIARVVVGDQTTSLAPAPAQARPPEAERPEADPFPRLGDYLVANGHISPEQLEAALKRQAGRPGRPQLLGQTLVEMGAITQPALDLAVAGLIQHMRSSRAEEAPAAEHRLRAGEKTVRTSVERLDSLLNLVGELITDRNRLYQIRGDFEGRFRGDSLVENLVQTAIHLGRITDQLQEEVMRIRLMPIGSVFAKFPRLVRDLARQAGKQTDLLMRGEDTELDRSVIEEISDPLIHLLRNAVDHGLEAPEERRAAGKPERGQILLTARHEEGRIVLTVEDDGRGIDAQRVRASALQKGLIGEAEAAALSDSEAIELIFKSGLSTARTVSDISGRGVGMDIVRSNIERLNGHVTVETEPGSGTRFQIVLPLTLAIVPTMLVQVGGRSGAAARTFAIPLAAVMEVLRVAGADIHSINGKPAIQLRGRVLPLARLDATLGFVDAAAAGDPAGGNGSRASNQYVMAVRWGKLELGLIVDRLIGEQELVVKSLGNAVGDTPGVSGAAILGDGSLALIVDIPGLFKLAGA